MLRNYLEVNTVMYKKIALRYMVRRTSSIGIDRGTLKFLTSLSQQKKGALSISVLKSVLVLLGNWKVESGPTFYPLNDATKYEIARWLEKRKGISHVNFDKGVGIYSKDLDSVLPLISGCGANGPSRPEKGKIYTYGAGDVVDHPWGSHMQVIPVKKAWVGTDGYTITAPNGAKLVIPEKLSEYSHDWENFTSAPAWKFLYENGLQEQAKAVLSTKDQGDIDKVLRPSQVRDLDNTGTCGVCFQNVKMRGDQTLHAHGYKVPKWFSGRVGGCPGTGWQPYELSPDASKHYLNNIIVPEKKRMTDLLTNLKQGPDTFEDIFLTNPKTYTRPEGDSRRYEMLLKGMEDKVTRVLDSIDKSQKDFDKIIRDWKKTPLPMPRA